MCWFAARTRPKHSQITASVVKHESALEERNRTECCYSCMLICERQKRGSPLGAILGADDCQTSRYDFEPGPADYSRRFSGRRRISTDAAPLVRASITSAA